MHILPYISTWAEFRPYEPVFAEVARLVGQLLRNAEPALKVEHIGSTSVPGCGGKGIIDLAVLYPDGSLARAREVLDELGFQKQGGPEPFPEERPLRVGAIELAGRLFRIHAHVIAFGVPEHAALVWFRDQLRANAELRRQYQERKQAILAAGINHSFEYCKAKGGFIDAALKARQPVA